MAKQLFKVYLSFGDNLGISSDICSAVGVLGRRGGLFVYLFCWCFCCCSSRCCFYYCCCLYWANSGFKFLGCLCITNLCFNLWSIWLLFIYLKSTINKTYSDYLGQSRLEAKSIVKTHFVIVYFCYILCCCILLKLYKAHEICELRYI